MELDVLNFIKPDLVILIPVLIGLGRILKSSERVCNQDIPLYLTITSIFLASSYILSVNAYENAPVEYIANLVFKGVVQGTLCASLAIFGHQLTKQTLDKDKKG